MEKKILDIGCGNNKAEGALGIDISSDTQADVIHDIEQFPYPFEDESFDEIVSKQVLEHLEKPLEALDEVYRLLKPGGKMMIQVPHFSCHYAFRSLHHKHFFSYFSLDTYLTKYGRFRYNNRAITFHKIYRSLGVRWWANKKPLAYERFFAFLFPAEHLCIELEVIK